MARVLVVGDGVWCTAVALRLSTVGHDVVSSASAIEAVRLAMREPPAVIVTQARLRGESGLQLCRLLRAELPVGEIPVVIVTPEAELGAAFQARAAGAAAHVVDVDALLRVLPSLVARTSLPPAVDPLDPVGLVSRLSAVLDRALFEGEIAAEVRALACVDDLNAMFDGLLDLTSQFIEYGWLGLVVNGKVPRFLLHAGTDYEAAEREAREALDLSSSIPCVRAGRVAQGPAGTRMAFEVPIFFGESQVGQLALALPVGVDRAAKKSVGLVAYELGGPLKIMALFDQVQRQAATDALTGIMNRRAFIEAAKREQARAARHGHEISLLIVDVDHFKRVNDVHGHPAGDAVLRNVARVLESTVRAADIVCRWGGEEFLIALPQANLSGALVVAEHLRENIEVTAHELPSGASIGVTVSIGVASASAPWHLDQVIAAADGALYDAKRAGRNRSCAAPEAGALRLSA